MRKYVTTFHHDIHIFSPLRQTLASHGNWPGEAGCPGTSIRDYHSKHHKNKRLSSQAVSTLVGTGHIRLWFQTSFNSYPKMYFHMRRTSWSCLKESLSRSQSWRFPRGSQCCLAARLSNPSSTSQYGRLCCLSCRSCQIPLCPIVSICHPLVFSTASSGSNVLCLCDVGSSQRGWTSAVVKMTLVANLSQMVIFPTFSHLVVEFTFTFLLPPIRPHTFCIALRESGGQWGFLGGAKMKISLSANYERTQCSSVTQHGP